jgi:hypothetical protein
MRLVSGSYEMGQGNGKGTDLPEVSSVVVLAPGSAYEMGHPDAWHYVRPVGAASMSVMVTGDKWERSAPKNSESLRELSAERTAELLSFFHRYYSKLQ